MPLYSAEDIALLPLTRLAVDWRAVRTVAAGRRSPLHALVPVPQVRTGVCWPRSPGIARVGRAAVVNWRHHLDFPAPLAGTTVHPEFDRRAVVVRLLAHDKIPVSTGVLAGAQDELPRPLPAPSSDGY
ncbi:hypothetical protein ACWCXX_39230 [Streptomyces sp. NPDC001732]